MKLPNELVDKVFLLSESEDIKKWEDYEKLSRITFMKKKDSNISDAAYCGNLIGVKYLHETEAPTLLLALFSAAQYGSVEIVKYLHEAGVDIHAYDDCALTWAIKFEHLEVVRYLTADTCNDGAIKWAAQYGNLEIVKCLVDAGADIHSGNEYALRRNAEKGHLEVVKYLVEVGADIHANDDEALEMAVFNGHLRVVKYLVEAGAR